MLRKDGQPPSVTGAMRGEYPKEPYCENAKG
jgi:hypothetical protein